MNYIPETAKMLGVEINKEFEIMTPEGYKKFLLTSDFNFVNEDGYSIPSLFFSVLRGDMEIKKIPWKPNDGEIFYYIGSNGDIYSETWCRVSVMYYLYNNGNIFKTKEEITDGMKQRILTEMKEKWQSTNS